MVSLIQRRHLPGSLSHFDKTPSCGFTLSQQLKAVYHNIMIEVKPLPLSSREFSPWYPGVISVPRALIASLSWSWLLYYIRLQLTDIETRRRQPRGHPFFCFLFVTRPLLFVEVYFSQVFRRKMDFDLEQHIHEFNRFRTYFRFLNTFSCK